VSTTQTLRIRTAITEVLRGSSGSVRIVPAGMFEGGVTAGHTVPGQQAKTLDHRFTHRFDVSVTKQAPNAATPISVKASYRLAEFSITVNFWTKLKATVLEADRELQRALIEGDIDVAIQALNYPGNLEFTLDGESTGIISGMLLGPDSVGTPVWELVEEDWKQHILRSRVTAAAKVKIVQPAAA
jgi:hypothetical protein